MVDGNNPLGEYMHQPYSQTVNAVQLSSRTIRYAKPRWEGLGEAYIRLGKYVASNKALRRAIELYGEDTKAAMHCRYRLAHVQRLLGAHAEALALYEQCLEADDGNVPVILGMAVCVCVFGTVMIMR